MGTAFSTSLFGLAGSLSLGFVDLQFTKAQNDFLMYVEGVLIKTSKNNISRLDRKEDLSEEYIAALLAETAEGISSLQKSLEKSESSRENLRRINRKICKYNIKNK